jgi:hypothetical protein
VLPLPLIFVGARLAVSAADAWQQRRERLRQASLETGAGEQLRLAVLGPQEVGKTTLINFWRGRGVNSSNGHTQWRDRHGSVQLAVNGRTLTLIKLDDVSGSEKQWSSWGEAADGSRFVLYLVNALTLAAEERRDRREPPAREWDRVEDDAGQIRPLLERGPVELCLLVVTHTDLDPRLAALGESGYHQHVSDQLDPIVFKLGGDRRVRLVTGSLATDADAEAVTAQIMAHLR